MADLNSMIAQGAQFQAPVDPFAQYGKLQQLQQNQQANALNQMKMDEYVRAQQESNALRQFLPTLSEGNRNQLLGYGAAGQGVFKALGEGDTQRRLAEQARSQADVNKSNILKNAVAQTRDAVAGIDPTDAPSYMALRESVLAQYPDLAPYMPAGWDANVKQRLITTAASVLEGQKPEPGFTLRPGDVRYPRGYTGVVSAPAAATAAAVPPSVSEYQFAKTADGGSFIGTYQDFVKAKADATRAPAPVAAPPTLTQEERNAKVIALGAGPEGSPEFNAALRAEILRMTAKPVPIAAPEPTTPEIKNAMALALGAGPVGSFAYNDKLQKELTRLTTKAEPVAAAPASSTEMKNADAFARLKGEPGTPAYNAEFAKQMARLTAKTGGGEGGTAVPKAPSGYRLTKTGDLEAIPGGPAASKPMTDLQKQALKKDFAADTSKVKAAIDTADEMEKLTDDLVGNPDKKIAPHPGLSGIKGFQGLLPSFAESPVTSGNAAKAEQKLETFKGKIKSLGRSIASLDGKLGNMAVQEWQMVSDSVQAIKPTAGNLDEQMRDAVRQARLLAKNLRDKFDLTYEDTSPATAPGRPASAANVITNPQYPGFSIGKP